MKTLDFLKEFGPFRRKQTEQLMAELAAARDSNANDFHREASDVEDCDPIGLWPHVHEPHDSKVKAYRLAAACAMVTGLAVAKQITEQAVIAALAQELTGGPLEISWKVTAFALGTFFAVGEMAKAYFNAIERKRFLAHANEWYGASLVAVGLTGSVLLIARVANSAIAPALAILEPWAWLGLEQSLIVSAAIAWVASRRFDWSRQRVKRDADLDEQIKAARRRLLATPHTEPVEGAATDGRPV